MALRLVVPAREYLDGYVDALRRGWSPDTTRPDAGMRELEALAQDESAFLAGFTDREGKGPAVTLPDGSQVQRLPGFRLWMWDGEFCGTIGFRWQPGTTDLPPHVLGHIGYAVVPWKRGRGYAKESLRLMLAQAHADGLAFVQVTTDPDNLASQRVIEANGGVLVERFTRTPQYGSTPALRYRIDLPTRKPAFLPAF
jgi:predicted acetyltransferase